MGQELRTNQVGAAQRRELVDSLIRQLTDFVVILLDQEGGFLTWHPGVRAIFGYTEQEFIGQHLEILYPVAERMQGVVERELETAKQQGHASDTRWLIKKGGECVFVDGLTISLRDDKGRPTGFGKVIHDVTHRRKTEEGLVALTRALGQSTVVVRQWDGTIEHWTDGCQRLYGFTEEEALGKPLQTLLQTSFQESRDAIQEQLAASGEWKGEVEQIARSGDKLQVMMNWVLLRREPMDSCAVIETHTDITDLMEMQREVERANHRLEQLAEELERSNRELEDFARIASHDLSSPITSTRWLIDLVLSRYKDRLDDGGRESLKQASANLERMSDLVEAVLTHARVGRDAIRSEQPVGCENALTTALAHLELEIRDAAAEITHEPLPEVHVRPEPLAQLFQNLVSNAIKYRCPGLPPKLHIASMAENGGWRLSFHDNGIGIATEFQKRIFQPMQRLHGHEITGSGIGLATCKKIAERAGGAIWVESAEGAGATFYVQLP